MTLTDGKAQAASFDEVADLVSEAQTIAICSHTSPDGDAIGSSLGLAEIIETVWPQKDVACILADRAPVPRIYRFLPGAGRLAPAAEYDLDPDLFVCVDLSAPSRLNDGEAVMRRARRVAVFDHHPSGDCFWDAGVVRTEAAATGIIVTQFALHVAGSLSATMAQNLFCAIVTDTGRFQYQNADCEAFATASLLVDAGASPAKVALEVYQSDRLNYLHLASKVMGRVSTFEHGRIAYSYATTADIEATGVSVDECDGLIDVVRCVEGAEVALFLKEVPGGMVRGNLRAKTDHDISGVARALGGGGHRAAAGFTLEGDVDHALSVTLPKLCALLDADGREARVAEGDAR